MSSALDVKIAEISANSRCRHCSKPIPPDAVICQCRIDRGELPHTEWGRDVKRFLCVRDIERQQLSHMTEQDLWVKLAIANYFGQFVGPKDNRHMITTLASIVEILPYAAGDAALWAAAGYPTSFHI